MNKVKSDRYYYDVSSDTIYAREFSSHRYYHEERHAKDMQKSWYRTLNSIMDYYLQMYSVCFIFFAVASIFLSDAMVRYAYLFLPYAIFRAQEEIRAEIYAREMTR